MKKMSSSRTKFLKSLFLMPRGVWLMRNFSSLHNKHKDAEEKLGVLRMLYFLKIEVVILSQCFQRSNLPSYLLALPQAFAVLLSLFWN